MRPMEAPAPPPRSPPRRSLAATLEGLLAMACAATGADAGAVYLRDSELGGLALAAGRGLPPEALGHHLALGEGLLGRVAAEGRSLISTDLGLDPRALRRRPDWDAEPPARAFLGVPLRAGDLIVGAIELTARRPDAFTLDHRRHAAILADAAALLIEQTELASQPPPAALEGSALTGDNPLGMLTLNQRLRVTGANPTFCRLAGAPVESLVGRPAVAALPVLGRPRAMDALEAALRGAPAHLGIGRWVDRQGQELSLNLSLIPLGDPSRGVAGVVVIVIDVTERARLEAELRARNLRLSDARDRLRMVVEVVSHELRTPLTSVLGYARLLYDRPEAEPARRVHWAGVVIEKARLMARLVDEVTDLARLGAARFSLRRAPTDLADLARAAAAEMATVSPAHRVEVEAAAGLPRVWLDRDRIQQVLGNLFANAVKHWPEGGTVKVEIRPDPEAARPDAVRAAPPWLQVRVLDRGPGIPAEETEAIFTPFHRLQAASGGTPGTGLGLAVSRGIVEAHGGRIWVEARPGGGSIFCFTLPTAPPAEDGAASPGPGPGGSAEAGDLD